MGHRHNRKRTRSRHGNHPALNTSYNASIHPAKIDYNTARFNQAQMRRAPSARKYSTPPNPAHLKTWSSQPIPHKSYADPLLPIQMNNVIFQQYQTQYAPARPKRYVPRDRQWLLADGSLQIEGGESNKSRFLPSAERRDELDNCETGLFASTEGVVRFLFDGHYDFVDAPV